MKEQVLVCGSHYEQAGNLYIYFCNEDDCISCRIRKSQDKKNHAHLTKLDAISNGQGKISLQTKDANNDND